MSGIAYAASTIPGSVATFRSCSSDASSRIASSSSASANTRAGTRISPSWGSSQSVSSSCRSSDIEDDPSVPGIAAALELEPVVRHRFDERPRVAGPPAHRSLEARVGDDEIRVLGNEPLGLGEEHELLEPLRE